MTMAFKEFIVKMLGYAHLKDEQIRALTSVECMDHFYTAFTHKSHDPVNNYELFETLGDQSLNKSVVWYFYRTYQNVTPEKITLLKNRYASTAVMAQFARSEGFAHHVLSKETNGNGTCRDKTLEDVLEAFLGCLEMLVDKHIRLCLGYYAVYNVVKHYLDTFAHDAEKDELLDPVSKLKIWIDKNKHRLNLHGVTYDSQSKVINGTMHVLTTVTVQGSPSRIVASGLALTKRVSQQKAAEQAIDTLSRM